MKILNNKNEEIPLKIKDEKIVNGQNNKINFICSKCGKEETIFIRQIVRRNIALTIETKLLCTSCYQKKRFKELYGVENPGQLEKTRKINSEKDHTERNKKIESTCLERYGVSSVLKIPEIREKIKETCLKKYGETSYLKTKEIQEIREKNNPMFDKKIVEKVQTTRKEKIDKIYDKTANTRKENQYNKIKEELPYEILNKYNGERILFGEKCEYIKYDLKCKTCGSEYKGSLAYSRCPICNPINGSQGEEEVRKFLTELHINFHSHNRELIKPYELDIVIPEFKLAIEYDGLRWHSNEFVPNNYHLVKTQLCDKIGYQLIHIFADEWKNKCDIVKSIIKAKLGIFDKKFYGRKLKIKEVDNTTAHLFYENNHIQGGINSSINVGLFNKEEIIQCVSFGASRFNKHYDYEITRSASIINSIVLGGFTKCLKYFINNYNGKIITYADLRYFTGNVYLNNGFKFINCSNPNYYYFKQDNKRYSRIIFQKHKLEKKLEHFDNKLTEKQNMSNNNWNWIYDCGNRVYALL
ncbi:MAG: hypothetical protein LBF97_08245 [Elusimicrobiota bacterium]|jgi:very-short-patch-repair endonuclease|nr:hypothetical protein [Elusimicrobiota bacterium]